MQKFAKIVKICLVNNFSPSGKLSQKDYKLCHPFELNHFQDVLRNICFTFQWAPLCWFIHIRNSPEINNKKWFHNAWLFDFICKSKISYLPDHLESKFEPEQFCRVFHLYSLSIMSIYLFNYLSIHLSIHPSIYLSIYLSKYKK